MIDPKYMQMDNLADKGFKIAVLRNSANLRKAQRINSEIYQKFNREIEIIIIITPDPQKS